MRPPALWDGSAVTWDELRPLLAERAGASILEELFLERQLDRMVTARSKMVSQELLDAEERELVASLSDDPARAVVLLNELRAAQGLGEKRWKSLLKRNAAMRLLVQDDVKVTPDAIEAVFPKAAVQLCLVHMMRHSLNFVGWKQRKEVAADLRLIYSAATEDEALLRLAEFEGKWDASFAPIGQSWRRNWPRLTPFFDYPADIRKVIYTTNAIESVNMSLRKITKTRGSFPTDEAVFKLFFLALNNISQKWTMPIRDWKAALNRFTIQFDERMPRV